jgi:predicted ester cyclase
MAFLLLTRTLQTSRIRETQGNRIGIFLNAPGYPLQRFGVPFIANHSTCRPYQTGEEMKVDSTEIVKAYYAALDSDDMDQIDQYVADNYQLVDFTQHPMDKEAMLEMMRLFKSALPNLKHSLSNIRMESNVVKLTVQLSGTNSANLDLRTMGIGVIPRSQKFIIFPNGNYEFTVVDEKITIQRDVSPISPNRRMSGMLKSLGVNVAAI